MDTTSGTEQQPTRAVPPPRSGGRGRRRRGVALGALVVLVAAGAGAGALAVFDSDGTEHDSTGSGGGTKTVPVARQALSQRMTVSGTLGYSGGYQVVNQLSGIVTWLPSVGKVIREGEVLYRVKTQPVILLKGAGVPMYRSLSRGMKGRDVRQLNASLVELKYADRDDLDPGSDYFGWATEDALEELQDHLNVSETGELELGHAVFLATDRLRVTKVNATYAGATTPNQAVLEGSSTLPQVTIKLEAASQSKVDVGDKVAIALPNSTTATGKVSSVGTVATTTSAGSTIRVDVKLDHPGQVGKKLDQATVQVGIVSDSVKDVLAVPVSALLAQGDGAYAVEVVDAAGTRRLVPVTTGVFDDTEGLVQVSGGGLAEGQLVAVPAS